MCDFKCEPMGLPWPFSGPAMGNPFGGAATIGASVAGAGELRELMTAFQRTYHPQQQERIARQAAKVIYGLLADRDPFAQLYEMGMLAILLSQAGPVDANFQRAIEQQMALIKR